MKILVVVDMQNDFVDGSLGTQEAVAIVPRVAEKIDSFDGMVTVTYDTHTPDYLTTQEGRNLPVLHCVEHSAGWQLTPPVEEALHRYAQRTGRPAEVFPKPTFGSVELAARVKALGGENIEEIILIGLCTDICVISNALLLKAFLPEVSITVDAACCAGVTPESHQNALAAMRMCQINVVNG